jgi:oligoribonuclease (3'-5' exoribonuclease)
MPHNGLSARPGLELMNSMNEWCINQHGKTGLTQACIDSPHTHEEVEEKVRAYLEKWIPETGAGLLAGSSVHADMRWVLLFPSFFHPSPLSSLLPIPYRCLPLHNAKAFISEWVLGPASNGALLIDHSLLRDVAADNRFLMLHMPSVMKRLSYRILGKFHPSQRKIRLMT